jgi:signal transduction histidine kinase
MGTLSRPGLGGTARSSWFAHKLAQCAIAVACVVAATAIQWALRSYLPGPHVLFFYPAVLAAAWLGGLAAGLLATALSSFAIAYFFLPPDFSAAISSPSDVLDLSLFSVLSVALVAFLVALRRALDQRECARREAEAMALQLERERALVGAIIEHAPVGVLFASPDDVIQIRNAWVRRASWGRIPARHGDIAELVDFHSIDGRKTSTAEWESLLREGAVRPVVVELEARAAPRPKLWVRNYMAPVRAEGSGRFLGTVIIVLDVSAEHEIAELRKELVAVIAHDLRSPIAAIQLSLESALRSRTDEETDVLVPAQTLERADRSARRLGGMVSQLLDASRVELGELSLDKSTVDLASFVDEIIGDVAPSLRDHPVITDFPAGPIAVSIDRLRIAGVVTNLLDNASKYSRAETPIRITLREDAGYAHLAVSDQGPGIDPNDRPKLFDRFFQARRARQQKSGLGLGLYIAKGIVEAHGGRMTVDSAPGVGSTFHVWLPALPSMPAHLEHAASP